MSRSNTTHRRNIVSPTYEATASSSSEPPVILSITADHEGVDFLITLTPPKEPTGLTPRAPVDIVFVVDVSGSMDAIASPPGENRAGIKATVLDLVKHAVRTVVASLGQDDRVSIVTFSATAEVIVPLRFTNDRARKLVMEVVENLETDSTTNIWEGLKTGMTVLTSSTREEYFRAQRLSSIFLLTDGQPTDIPPLGHIPMLKNYLTANSPIGFTINTFGFGNGLDSKLLLDIATVGKGNYGFIADAGMVGTVFIHAAANTYATFSDTCNFDVELEDEGLVNKLEILGGLETLRTSQGVNIDVGALQFGQTKDVVVRVLRGLRRGNLTVTAKYRPWFSPPADPDSLLTCTIGAGLFSSAPVAKLIYQTHRVNFVQEVLDLFPGGEGETHFRRNPPPGASGRFEAMAETIRSDFVGNQPDKVSQSDAHALAADIEGEVVMALNGKWDKSAFAKWGRHYLPSLARSHQRQQCGNFKDEGLQVYGRDSPLFIRSRDEMDKLFNSLPPPASTAVDTSSAQSGVCYVPTIPQSVPRAQMLRKPSIGTPVSRPVPSPLSVVWPPPSPPSPPPSFRPPPATASVSIPGSYPWSAVAPPTVRHTSQKPAEIPSSAPPSSSPFIVAPTPRVASASPTASSPSPTEVQYVIASIPTPPLYPCYILIPSVDPSPPSPSDLVPRQQAPPPQYPQPSVQRLSVPSIPAFRPKEISPMANWNNKAAPCFAGGCLVDSASSDPAEHATIRVDQLVRGTKLRTLVGPRSVAAIIRTAISSGELELCAIGDGGLLVTPWHPIKRDEWVFPARICSPSAVPCSAVYSILLEPDDDSNAHAVWIGGVLCVTLGHGIVSSNGERIDARAHPFLGDYAKVVQSLAENPAFYERDGVLEAYGTQRAKESGLVCGFAWKMGGAPVQMNMEKVGCGSGCSDQPAQYLAIPRQGVTPAVWDPAVSSTA